MSSTAALSRTSHGAAVAARAFLQRVADVLEAMRNRREVVRLLESDPAMLKDLGLTPMDVNCALAEPMWRDPSARLLVWSIERRAAARAAARDNLLGLRHFGPVGQDN